MSAALFRQAAERLQDPVLCNWDRRVAHALADHFNQQAMAAELGGRVGESLAAVARAVLREDQS